MTTNDLLALVKGHLSGDAAATKQLADAFLDADDGEGERLVREGSFTLAYDGEEANGRVRVAREIYGPALHIGTVAGGGPSLVLVDLYASTANGRDCPAAVRCYDANCDEPLVSCRFDRQGRLSIEVCEMAANEVENGGPMTRTFQARNRDEEAPPCGS